jgi:cytochrome b involved in lipid metabolism
MHKYVGKQDFEAALEGGQVPRAKVPVRDGRSQNKFMQEAQKIKALTQDADRTFYTMEEVKEHRDETNCWTVYQGRIYDITDYAKVHPGGRKIFLGKGKDCTQLFQ